MTDQDTSFEPSAVHDHFIEITKRPHCSGSENAVRSYIVEQATKLGAEVTFYQPDASEPGQRVIVARRPGKGALAGAPWVVLQAHTDMVCVSDTKYDPIDKMFPLDVYKDKDESGEEWLHARGTTLGADDGIGVAVILALLQDDDLKDYPLECFFTVQEETDMGGAAGFDPALLQGRVYINLDAEDWGTIIYGSAGGCETTYQGKIKTEPVPATFTALKFSVTGLRGGHSGLDISKGRLNACKVLAAVLARLDARLTDLSSLPAGARPASYDLRIAGFRRSDTIKMNAIPTAAEAIVCLPGSAAKGFAADFFTLCAACKAANMQIEADMSYGVADPTDEEARSTCLNETSTDGLLRLISHIPHGPLTMVPDRPGLVETSTNMANVTLGGDDPADLTISVSNRSSNDGCLEALVAIHESTGRLFSAPESLQIEVDGGLDGRYPAWQPNGASKLLAAAEEVYAKTFGPGYDATIIHAGLECGYAVQKYEKTDQPMDCISIGPTIQNPHTVNERLKLSTVEPFYDAVKALVKQLCNP